MNMKRKTIFTVTAVAALLLGATSAQAAIALVGCEGVSANIDPDRTVDVPAGTQDGHGMLAFYSHHVDDMTPVGLDGGWTKIDERFNTVGVATTVAAWWRIADDEPADYDFIGGGEDSEANGTNGTAIICTFSGVHASLFDTAFDSEDHFRLEVNEDEPVGPPITTTRDGAMVVLYSAIGLNNVSNMECPSSGGDWSEAIEVNGGGSRHANVCLHTQDTAGTVTPGASLHTDLTGNDETRMYILALRPEGGKKFYYYRRN